MKNKHYKTLGLDKILHMLSLKVDSQDAKNKILNIEPSTKIHDVQKLLNETLEAHSLMARYKSPSFASLKNIESPLKRSASGGILTTLELLKIAGVLSSFDSISDFRKSFKESSTFLDEKFNLIYTNKTLKKKIYKSIISEDEIADEASLELARIRRKINLESNNIRSKLDKLTHSSSLQKYLQDSIVTIRDGRFVIPVKSEFKNQIQGLIHDTSATGSTVFIEPISIVNLNNEIKILKNAEKKEIERILWELSRDVSLYWESILKSYWVAIDLNIIFAKADLAYSMKACIPTLNEDGKINFKNARHPLIDSSRVVPIDINLGIDFDTLVITGPNTGGKTVTLKTVGLLTLMAMCGLMIPADENSTISIFKNIFADIGDEQSIEQSLSTFSSHIKNIIEILSLADKNSLVLLDELGVGTDPVEGAALATAILENLRNKNAKIIATTHYSELKSFALTTLNVENASCEFDVKSLKPTYKLLIGIPGSSNAFAISSRLGMDNSVIKKASEFLSEENTKFENVIKKLEETRREIQENLKASEILKEQIKNEKILLEKEKSKIKKQCELELTNAKNKAQQIVFKTSSKANFILDKLEALNKQSSVSKNSLNALKKDISKMEEYSDPVDKKSNSGYILPRKLKVGDEVLIFDIDKKATVLKIHQNNEATVYAGIIKTRVPISNLRLLNSKKVSKPTGQSSHNVKSKMSSKVFKEIDLRGLTVLEATVELDKFIDDAILSGANQITIIHGKGTGTLRNEVHKYLKSHPSIKSFRLGNFGEGESGVTIAEI